MRFPFDADRTVIEKVKSQEPLLLNALTRAANSVHKVAASKATGKARALLRSPSSPYVLVLSTAFNASILLRQSDFLISMNFGLCKFYSEMTRMLFSRINVMSEAEYKAAAKKPSLVTPQDTAQAAKVLMEAFWEKELPDRGLLPQLELTENTAGLYRLFLLYGLRFSVGHELAHLLIEESPGYDEYRESGERVVEQFVSQNPNLPREMSRRLIRDWGVEFGADVLGLELSLEAEEDGSLKWFQMYASEWFFVMCDMLYRYHAATRGSLELGSHPAPFMRLDVLRSRTGANQRAKDLTQALEHGVAFVFEELGISKYSPGGRVRKRTP